MSKGVYLPTTSGLMAQPAAKIAARFLQTGDWKACREMALKENLMQAEKRATASNYVAYAIKLLKTLTPHELELLSRCGPESARALMWLGLCRAYPLVGKFAKTVINGKFNRRDFHLDAGDWREFLSREGYERQEVEDIPKSTRAKARSVVFGNLKSAGYLSSLNELKDAALEASVAAAIGDDIGFFPVFIRRE